MKVLSSSFSLLSPIRPTTAIRMLHLLALLCHPTASFRSIIICPTSQLRNPGIIIRRMENSSSQQPRKSITFVTGNKNKLAEVQRLLSTTASSCDDQLSTLPFDIINHKLDLPELQGTSKDMVMLCLETFFLNSWPIFTFSGSVES